MYITQSSKFRAGKLPGWLKLLLLESAFLLAVFGFFFGVTNLQSKANPAQSAPKSNLPQNCTGQLSCAFLNQVPTTTVPVTTKPPTTVAPTITPIPTTPIPTTPIPTTPIPTTVVPTTPIPTTLAPTTPVVRPAKSAIGGTVFLDGAPTGGFIVRIEPVNKVQTTGPDGKYYFNELAEGLYVVRVINYDASKVKATIQDFSNQTVTGDSVESRIDFPFVSLAGPTTTAPATTAPPTTAIGQPGFNPSIVVLPGSAPVGTLIQIKGTGWNPRAGNDVNKVTVVLDDSPSRTGSSGAISGFSLNNAPNNLPVATLGTFEVAADGSFVGQANLPSVAPQRVLVVANDLNGQRTNAPFVVEPGAECPAVAPGNGLRIATKEVKRNATDFYLCLQVVAGVDGVDLNDTVIVNLPSGVSVVQSNASLGTVSVSNNSVRWGGFGLNARQSTTLVLSLSTPNGSLQGTSLFVSGRFNQGQSFQQRIPGLPPLTEINAPAAGQGGGDTSAAIPVAAPATGVGNNAPTESFNLLPVLLVSILVWLLSFGLIVKIRRRRNN